MDETQDLTENVDFTIVSFADDFVEGYLYDATKEDLYTIEDFQRFQDKFILIDTRFYNDSSIDFIIRNISKNVAVKGFLLIESNQAKFNEVMIDKRGERQYYFNFKKYCRNIDA